MDQSTAWDIESHLEDISDKTMTKRERIATEAMAALISRNDGLSAYDEAILAVRYADALIKELNKGK